MATLPRRLSASFTKSRQNAQMDGPTPISASSSGMRRYRRASVATQRVRGFLSAGVTLWLCVALVPLLLAGQAASFVSPAIAAPLYLVAMLPVAWRSGRTIAAIHLVAATAAYIAGAAWTGVTAGEITVGASVLMGLTCWMRSCRNRFMAERAAADIDCLTGAMTARGFRKVLRREIGLGTRDARSIGLVFLDLDHFKDINDRYGHDEGDKVLQALVGALRARLLHDDHVARLGGDEFLILLRYVEGNDTIRWFRTTLAEVFAEVGHGLTASVGGIILEPGSKATEATLIARTDRLMYQIKHGGKADMLFERFDEARIERAAA
ncbi:MAG: GGDEF domain-containing protein [Sphingomonas sp.]